MPPPNPSLVQILKQPELALNRSLPEWDLLIRQARHSNLLGRLHHGIETTGVLGDLPEQAQRHLIAGGNLADRLHRSVRHEISELNKAMDKAGLPLILLKGAAYVAAQLPAAHGRIFADIDLLVPKASLGEAESSLMLHGWTMPPISAYDQQYYRRWMHELPPMQHIFRGTSIDVHHAILPPTARYHPNPGKILADSVSIPALPGVRTLSPTDLILHSATHLFHEGEADNALRDLSDLDLLLEHWGTLDPENFWNDLLKRAVEQQLGRPLWLALHFADRIFSTDIPARVQAQLDALAPSKPGKAVLDTLYDRIFVTQHPSTDRPGASIARKALYIRGHWLRMPAHLLSMHLLRKAFAPDKPKRRAAAAPDGPEQIRPN
ncbi:MAG: nucleotidyltransferase family protein [Azoarcus sp.]|jgi:hypothetical protein|nr:nucleotidyltransferase family protein [Azoarcus sp.]MDD2873418.1 nucleotidyltransferase family protein [Azoarcus sp.]MDX9837161.1 nucleotidyltransferase family protein [Azoarcus sp.]